jgi:hypothetical protein
MWEEPVASLLGQWLATAPLWLVASAMFGSMIVAALLGWRLRNRRIGKGALATDAAYVDGQEGYIVSSVMGLLALLMGFTFSMAIDRYDTRRERVLLEANAIGTTYLRAQLLEEPHRARLSGLLVDYVDTRLVLASSADPVEQGALLAASNQQVTDLWTATVAAWPTMKGLDFSSSFLESMNQLTEMDAARQASRSAHVPGQVFMLLFVYQITAAGVMGFVLSGSRGRQIAVALLVLFGMSLLLVIDIDRPVGGGISESQGPMLQLQATLKARPPEVFDRFAGHP